MKILIFEYVCGGGFAGQDLPPSLAAEGSMMLQTLLAELKRLPGLSLQLMLDQRLAGMTPAGNVETILITAGQDVMQSLPALIAQCDAVWPIAPESGGILAAIAGLVRDGQKILLASTAETIALCGDKLATYRSLLAYGLPLAETVNLTEFRAGEGSFVVKPRDGAGCQGSFIVRDGRNLPRMTNAVADPGNYIVQPFYQGSALSLSCLCRQGRGWLLCCNRQQVRIANDRFELEGCQVNVASQSQAFYRQLADKVAAAIPGLWGYIGLDLLETPEKGPLLLEINPRLTTSYCGIGAATGVNVAEQALNLLNAGPDLPEQGGRVVEVRVSGNAMCAQNG